MTFSPEEERRIRHYLLSDPARGDPAVEERMLRDEDFIRHVQLTEEELIEDYVLDRLDSGERELFEGNFLTTPARRQKMVMVRGLVRYAGQAERVRPTAGNAVSGWLKALFQRRRVVMAVCALLVCGFGLGAWRLFFHRSELDEGLLALNRAYRLERPLEARITGLAHAPANRVRGNQPEQVDYVARRHAESLLLGLVASRPDASSRHALGRVFLANREFDKAIDQLEQAVQANPGDALIHADLGAALLEKGKQQRSKGEGGAALELFAASLEHLGEALKLRPDLAEALFNRALVHEALALPQEAIRDWQTYLEKDPSGPWADEAGTRLSHLTGRQQVSRDAGQLFQDFLVACRSGDQTRLWQVITRGRDRTGSLITESLLDEYLTLTAVGSQQEARERLHLLAVAGELEQLRAGDRFTRDLSDYYRRATPGQLQQMVRARGLVKTARTEFLANRFRLAAELFRQGAEVFTSADNYPEMMLAGIWRGHSLLRVPELDRSLAIYENLIAACEGRQYRWLCSQALNGVADNQSSRSEFSKALEIAGRAREMAEQIGDSAGVLRNLQLALSMQLQFGHYRESLEYAARAFAQQDEAGAGPRQLWPFYFENSLSFLRLGYLTAALDCQQEALRLAREAAWPIIICRSYTRLGMIHEARHDYPAALSSLRTALDAAAGIALSEGRMNLTSYTLLQMGNTLLGAADPLQALQCFDRAVEQFGALKIPYELFLAHKGRLQALVRLGRVAEAETELEEALRLCELHRRTITEESSRDGFFDLEQEIYDLAIGFAFGTLHDPQQAFDYAEASRARSLLDLLAGEPELTRADGRPGIRLVSFAEPQPLSVIRQQMPETVQVIQYAILQDRILIQVLSRAGLQTVERAVSAGELRSRVFAFREAVAVPPGAGESGFEAPGRELYDLLIGPVRKMLDSRKTLCLVPDGPLHEIPFAALISPDTGRCLGDEFTLTYAPGTSVFIRCLSSDRACPAAGGERLLSVGNPSFDQARFPGLPDLPEAAEEAQAVAALYPLHVLLTGKQATRIRVIDAMRGAEVIHLAAHARADLRDPLRSQLLLARDPAADPADDGTLPAFELCRLKLPVTRLVVLSACSTGYGPTLRGEGILSLARPFLAAGAPSVVASLWPVDSAVTTELMTSFHQFRRAEGLSAAEALQRAQQKLRAGAGQKLKHPYYWASFVSIGA